MWRSPRPRVARRVLSDEVMQKNKRKLNVSRETLRTLSNPSMTSVAGGMSRHDPGGCNFSGNDGKTCKGSNLLYGCDSGSETGIGSLGGIC